LTGIEEPGSYREPRRYEALCQVEVDGKLEEGEEGGEEERSRLRGILREELEFGDGIEVAATEEVNNVSEIVKSS
jgi:hypothetical protein